VTGDGRSARLALRYVVDATPPAAGAVVMGTGIVSIGLSLDGLHTPSSVLLVLAALAWVALGLLFIARAAWDRERARRESRSPAGLTSVAATAVLGTRLTLLGWGVAGLAMLAIAVCLWLVLLGPVLTHWTTPTVGVSLVLAVSTESLAMLSATLAAREHHDWLLYASTLPFVLGLGFYAFVLAHFDPRQLLVGAGDHWVTGGALAISALAAGRITLAARSLAQFTRIAGDLRIGCVVLWGLAITWLPVLTLVEILRVRLTYDVRRWSTVFPVGMYAACSFIVATAAHVPALAAFARVWVWAGVAVWILVTGSMLQRGWQLARGGISQT
jgi:tellurite resistance protein TehA-like permease